MASTSADRPPQHSDPPWFPDVNAPFGSDEHLEWLARRLSKNLRFRREVEEGAKQALAEYEFRARHGLAIPLEVLE
jgi:hypothetical protein